MKTAVACVLLSAAAASAHAQDILDRASDRLTFTAFNDQLRARLSGTLDLEFYHFDQPPPGLIDSKIDNLFNPRLTLFVDGQAGPQVYFFLQTRVDRGFDPSEHGADVRLDEYAMRYTPWRDGRVTLQVGKFATVVGNFVPRHLPWDNPFVNAPLPYENVTALEDRSGQVAPNLERALLFEKYEFIPVIWGPSYANGVSLSGKIENFDYAVEVKNASLSSRPEVWDVTNRGFEDPTVSARIGYRPNPMWNFGFSASDGAYLASGPNIGDFHQKLLGQDIAFAWHHFQAWAEFYEARFEIPGRGGADTFAGYIEAKYKFTPEVSAALRWNQQFFSSIDKPVTGQGNSLGEDLSRMDAAVAYRFTAHTQLKVQYSFQQETNGAHADNQLFAAQFTIRF
jgi:hypothetical protein